jgi:drug/metabolite transporter (DMT)-like permease
MRLRGYASLYAAAVLFALTSIAVKLASRYYGGLFISAFRFALGVALCLAVSLIRYGGIKVVNLKPVVMRGVFGAVSMASSYAAISYTAPGRAALLGNTYPVFVGILAVLFFGEKLRKGTVVALAACTLGALLVVRDGSGASIIGDSFAIVGALTAGFAVNYVRRAGATENPFTLYLSPCLFGLPVLAFGIPQAGSFSPIGIALAAAVGVLAFVAQALMARGYQEVSASSGSVVFYVETGLTVLLGVLVVGERPNAKFLAGLVLIAAGLLANRPPSFLPGGANRAGKASSGSGKNRSGKNR